MSEHHYRFIGVGLYSVQEAARLTGTAHGTIRRWVNGYARVSDGVRVQHPPITRLSLPKIEDQIALSFRDLMEIRFIGRLRRLEIPWGEIKNTVELARTLLSSDHPFSTLTFKTDGRQVFAAIEKSGALLRASQYAFAAIFEPSLFAELDYDGDEIVRWRPGAGANVVVLDPKRSFGKPLLDEYDVQTHIISAAVAAEGSISRVSDWYDIPLSAVRVAVDFERQLRAA